MFRDSKELEQVCARVECVSVRILLGLLFLLSIHGCAPQMVRTAAERNAQNEVFRKRAMPDRLKVVLHSLDDNLAWCTQRAIASYAFKQQRAFADREPPHKATVCKGMGAYKYCRAGNERPSFRFGGEKYTDYGRLLLENIGLDFREPHPRRKAWEAGMRTGVLQPLAKRWLGINAEPVFDSYLAAQDGSANASAPTLKDVKSYVASHDLTGSIVKCVQRREQGAKSQPSLSFGECITSDEALPGAVSRLEQVVDKLSNRDWSSSSLAELSKELKELSASLEGFGALYQARLKVCATEVPHAKTGNLERAAFESRYAQVMSLKCGRFFETSTLCYEDVSSGYRLTTCQGRSAWVAQVQTHVLSWTKAADLLSQQLLEKLSRAGDARYKIPTKNIGIGQIEYPARWLDQTPDVSCLVQPEVRTRPKFAELMSAAEQVIAKIASAEDDALRKGLTRMEQRIDECLDGRNSTRPSSSSCVLTNSLYGGLSTEWARQYLSRCGALLKNFESDADGVLNHPRCGSAEDDLERMCRKVDSFKGDIKMIEAEVNAMRRVLPNLVSEVDGLATGHQFDAENRTLLNKCRSNVSALKRKARLWKSCMAESTPPRATEDSVNGHGGALKSVEAFDSAHVFMRKAAKRCASQSGITALINNGQQHCKWAVQANGLLRNEAQELAFDFMPELTSAKTSDLNGETVYFFSQAFASCKADKDETCVELPRYNESLVPKGFQQKACYQKVYIQSNVLRQVASSLLFRDTVYEVEYMPVEPFTAF